MSDNAMTYARMVIVIALLATVVAVAIYLDDDSQTLGAIITPIIALVGIAVAFMFAKNGVDESRQIKRDVIDAKDEIRNTRGEVQRIVDIAETYAEKSSANRIATEAIQKEINGHNEKRQE